ncbi:hypothetical protein [Streptomyces cylindrosporus]|nr:hypothetical protein [Streptomyces cylindrosporus]
MHFLVLLGASVALFLALPWLVIPFNKYCDAVNRFMAKRKKG